MNISFNPEMGCWTFLCAFGCFGFDYEGSQEALEAFLDHKCPMSC